MLMVFGLDHLVSEQEAAPEEIAAIREWLKREGTCLMLAPHHDVGFTTDMKQRQMEYRHHRDPLVPRQQRFGQYTRSLMKGLDVPVMNKYGLRPATVKGTNDLEPVTAYTDADKLGLLKGVTTFNFHPHLPHYEITGSAQLPSACWRANLLISTARIRSSRRATRNSIASFRCRRHRSDPAIFCWPTQPSLQHCLAFRTV